VHSPFSLVAVSLAPMQETLSEALGAEGATLQEESLTCGVEVIGTYMRMDRMRMLLLIKKRSTPLLHTCIVY
jgi:hypothetical protein